MNHEFQVLHIGRTVAVWRDIVAGLRVGAQFAKSPREAAELTQRARDIESQLPLSSTDQGATK